MNRRIKKKIHNRGNCFRWSYYYNTYCIQKEIDRRLKESDVRPLGPNDWIRIVTTRPGRHCKILRLQILRDCCPVGVGKTKPGNMSVELSAEFTIDKCNSPQIDDMAVNVIDTTSPMLIGVDPAVPGNDMTYCIKYNKDGISTERGVGCE